MASPSPHVRVCTGRSPAAAAVLAAEVGLASAAPEVVLSGAISSLRNGGCPQCSELCKASLAFVGLSLCVAITGACLVETSSTQSVSSREERPASRCTQLPECPG